MSKLMKIAVGIAMLLGVSTILLADRTPTASESTKSKIDATIAELELRGVIEAPAAKKTAVRPRQSKMSMKAKEARARQADRMEARSNQLPEGQLPSTDSVSTRVISRDGKPVDNQADAET